MRLDNCRICDNLEYLETHHIHGRGFPEYNKKWNKVDVCSNCHTRIHLGSIIIERWCMSTKGRLLLWHYKDEEGVTQEPAKPYLYHA